MINVCVPVLRRYDMLKKLIASVPTKHTPVYIIDNGRNPEMVKWALAGGEAFVHTPAAQMGVAESWNWFIDNVDEDRVISNDDIEFAPDSLERMAASPADFVSCSFGFSCFLIRQGCIDRVGRFDETISPGYAYFEDMDYLRRMRVAGVEDAVVECGVIHHYSQTVKGLSAQQLAEHNRRFYIAQENYTQKWGAPSWEQLKTINGQGATS
jgi:GT2 family glycosyltransferase